MSDLTKFYHEAVAFLEGLAGKYPQAAPTINAAAASLGQAGAVSHAPAVIAAMAVSRVPATSRGTVLAINARRAAATVDLRPDLSALPAGELWRRITPTSAQPGLALPGRPARIEIRRPAAARCHRACAGRPPGAADRR